MRPTEEDRDGVCCVSKNDLTPYAEIADVLTALPVLVREKRRRDGLSVRATARIVGLSFSTISRFESGEDIVLSNAVALLRWVGEASR